MWTWTAIDADTKLIVSRLVSTRDAGAAYEFMQDLASRMRGRVQLTADGHRPYRAAVEGVFGFDIDYATLTTIYGVDPWAERRYNFARVRQTLRVTPAMKAGIARPDVERRGNRRTSFQSGVTTPVDSKWGVTVAPEKGAGYKAAVRVGAYDLTGYFFGTDKTPLEAVEAALSSIREEKRRFQRGRIPDNCKVAKSVRPRL